MGGKLTNWSAENATKAYLKTLKMGINRSTEPDESEFISALAAGNDAQLMVAVCSENINPATLLALVAAAHQTGGRVVCIFRGLMELETTIQAISQENVTDHIEFLTGDAERIILEDYKEVDFVLNDCKLNNHEAIAQAMQSLCRKRSKGSIVLGCNALSSSSWQWTGVRTQLLPIGEGLLVTKISSASERREQGRTSSFGRKSHWVVKVDEHTGEEHVIRVRCHNGKEIGC